MTDGTLFFTSPDACAEKDAAVQRIISFLSSLPMEYRGLCHSAAHTMADCETVEAALGAPILKNLFLCNAQQTAFYLLILPGEKVFKTKYLSKQIGSARLSFAGAEHMQRLLRVAPGSAGVFSLLFDENREVRLLIDRDVLALPEWGFHPGRNTATLRVSAADVLERFLPAIGRTAEFVDLPDAAPAQSATAEATTSQQ